MRGANLELSLGARALGLHHLIVSDEMEPTPLKQTEGKFFSCPTSNQLDKYASPKKLQIMDLTVGILGGGQVGYNFFLPFPRINRQLTR